MCSYSFCLECLAKLMTENPTNLQCPVCRRQFIRGDIRLADDIQAAISYKATKCPDCFMTVSGNCLWSRECHYTSHCTVKLTVGKSLRQTLIHIVLVHSILVTTHPSVKVTKNCYLHIYPLDIAQLCSFTNSSSVSSTQLWPHTQLMFYLTGVYIVKRYTS